MTHQDAPAIAIAYPIHLQTDAIRELIPHRGEMLLIQQATVHAHNHYTGHALWACESAFLRGHFPGMPVVPGVLLVEAVAQLTGIGLLAGDSYAKSMGAQYVGVLAGIRKCSFIQPVLPEQRVDIEVHTRQMSAHAANATAQLAVAGVVVAAIEVVIINTLRELVTGMTPAAVQ